MIEQSIRLALDIATNDIKFVTLRYIKIWLKNLKTSTANDTR